MTDFFRFKEISSSEIFSRIDASTTVITPNRRLALTLKSQFHHNQLNQELLVWLTPDILPLSALVERFYYDAFFTDHTPTFPFLLSPAQEQCLWESIIQSSETGKALLRISSTAKQVREAWQLAQAWRLLPKFRACNLNEDAQAFLDWSERYQQITVQNRQIDRVRAIDLIAENYRLLNVKKPETLICYGFDRLTPQQTFFLEHLDRAGCTILVADLSKNSAVHQSRRVEFRSRSEEILHVAAWARSKLETTHHQVSIGIVVPALSEYRSELLRVFRSVMYPDVRCALPDRLPFVAPHNVSLGQSLLSYPLIDAALITLELLVQEVAFNRFSQWLQCPFLAGADDEMQQRAILGQQLRQFVQPFVTLEGLLGPLLHCRAAKYCPVLQQLLVDLVQFRRNHFSSIDSHAAFAQQFNSVLRIAGLPGSRTPSSTEYQVFEKWQQLLKDFSTLDHVQIQTGDREAVIRLQRMAQEVLFQPQTPEVPIQILGVLEAAGMTFDHLWVMGLSEQYWPLHSSPNPFLPLELQRREQLTLGSPNEALAFSQRLTRAWFSAATEVIVSYPRFSGESDGQEAKSSPLIRHLLQHEPEHLALTQHVDLIIQSCRLEYLEDSQVLPIEPKVAGMAIKGGTQVIKDYAACPFRAWAKYRLSIRRPDIPHEGLNALERGSLVHLTMALFWEQLKSRQNLELVSLQKLEQLIGDSVGNAIRSMQKQRSGMFTGRFAQIERQRLIRLVREWLEIEKKREDFTVIAIEQPCSVSISGIKFNGRLDRVDELTNGQYLIIDYKTGRQSVRTMIGERPDEPQLPMYLVASELTAPKAGVAFATIKQEAMEFVAVLREDNLLPGVKVFTELNGYKTLSSWEELVAVWQKNLTDLAIGFASGNATVDPKNFPETCRYCELQSFCRIYERKDLYSSVRNENSEGSDADF